MNPVMLDKPVKINDIVSGEGFTFTTNFEDIDNQTDEEDDESDLKLSAAMENINIQDEDSYDFNQYPFYEIMEKMTNVDDKGLLMKRIFHEGIGEPIPKGVKARVTFHYKAYQEFQAGAYDSTYQRRKPMICKLNNGEIILGLDMAVGSMRRGESSQFIMHPDLAYGSLGCILIPADTALLYEVTLLSFVELPPDYDESTATEDDKTDFPSNYERAVKLCNEAGYLCKNQKKFKPAVVNYNTAINALSSVMMRNEDECEKYVAILLRIYMNLAICHNQLEHYKKACINCQEVFKLCNTYHQDPDAKVYYNLAKARFHLGDCDRADEALRTGARLCSLRGVFHKEFMGLKKKIDQKRAEQNAATKKLAQAMFRTNEKK